MTEFWHVWDVLGRALTVPALVVLLVAVIRQDRTIRKLRRSQQEQGRTE